MAIGDFYMDIPNFPEVYPNKEQKWDNVTLYQQTEANPVVYKPVDGLMHRSFVLSAEAVTTIATNPALTETQKRAAVLELVADKIRATGIVESWIASQAFLSILPNDEWPIGGYEKLLVSLD